MILVFFQNCLSPHQIPYIRECSNDERVEKVYFVMPRIDYSVRARMGWDSKKMLSDSTIRYMLKPDDNEVKKLLSQEKHDIRCFFSGIRADADVFRWLNISIAYNVKRYIITEPPFTYNKPLWMHYLRFLLMDYRYVRYIDGIFAIGEACEKYYCSISKRWKVFPFMYVTEKDTMPHAEMHGNMEILYVGSLSKRKNVKVLIEALNKCHDVNLNVVGDGEERTSLANMAKDYGFKVNFFGTLPMDAIPKVMQRNDVLVLPSLHDGWGAVVNEALQAGCYIICSDACGAMDLIHRNQNLGMVFRNNDCRQLANRISLCKNNLNEIRKNCPYRQEWTVEHISGTAVAKYFVDCLCGEYEAPVWRQK